jgi:cysteine synthase
MHVHAHARARVRALVRVGICGEGMAQDDVLAALMMRRIKTPCLGAIVYRVRAAAIAAIRYECHLNSEAHDDGTGAEIWQQTHGAVTHFVAGGSTGGTITGVGRHLKRQNPATKVVLADPVGSIFHGE